MKKLNKNKTITGPSGDFIRRTLDAEPKVELLISSFAKTFKNEFGNEVSKDNMKGIYNMILFLACSIIDIKNKQKEDEVIN